jgi:FKBP-type peptidyl-prolyl cis-trans isomerase
MKFFLLSFLAVTAGVLAQDAASDTKEVPKELGIETTFMPAECPNKAKTGDAIQVHYTGTLHANGNKFDSSLDRGQPLPITLGVGQVIPGWDKGLQGMCLGEKRILTIPSNMAYGSRGFGNIIPSHSALVFDVELVGLEPKTPREEL